MRKAQEEQAPTDQPKPTEARFALSRNLRFLMENYTEGFKRGISSRELEKRCGVSYKTIDRMLNPYEKHGPNLDSMDPVAHFFRVPTWELLVPRAKSTAIAGEHSRVQETAPILPSAVQNKKRMRG